jgi:hypothetical protein
MKKPSPSRNVSELIALIDSMIAYWKAIAERNYKNAHPFSDSDEFERRWPRTLDNFFLAETVRTANSLRRLSEGREN